MTWQDQISRLRAPRLNPRFVSEAANPDLGLPWVPEKLTPLYDTKNYAALSRPQQLTYNQSYALQLAEEFCWIEDQLIVAPLQGVRRRLKHNGEALQVIESFIQDEHAHVSAFETLRAKGASVLNLRDRLFKPTAKITMLGRLASFVPHHNTFWIEVIRTFETYAVEISQAYHEDKTVDATFSSAFVAHGQDEARHVQYDDLLAELLKENQPSFLSAMGGKLSTLFLESYYSPEWGIEGPIQSMIAEHPELKPCAESLRAEAMLARDIEGNAGPVEHRS